MSITVHKPTAAHVAFRDDAVALLRKHAGHLDATDLLALAAQMVGQLIALQDQRKVTREIALEIVTRNIEEGNSSVISSLDDFKGQA